MNICMDYENQHDAVEFQNNFQIQDYCEEDEDQNMGQQDSFDCCQSFGEDNSAMIKPKYISPLSQNSTSQCQFSLTPVEDSNLPKSSSLNLPQFNLDDNMFQNFQNIQEQFLLKQPQQQQEQQQFPLEDEEPGIFDMDEDQNEKMDKIKQKCEIQQGLQAVNPEMSTYVQNNTVQQQNEQYGVNIQKENNNSQDSTTQQYQPHYYQENIKQQKQYYNHPLKMQQNYLQQQQQQQYYLHLQQEQQKQKEHQLMLQQQQKRQIQQQLLLKKRKLQKIKYDLPQANYEMKIKKRKNNNNQQQDYHQIVQELEQIQKDDNWKLQTKNLVKGVMNKFADNHFVQMSIKQNEQQQDLHSSPEYIKFIQNYMKDIKYTYEIQSVFQNFKEFQPSDVNDMIAQQSQQQQNEENHGKNVKNCEENSVLQNFYRICDLIAGFQGIKGFKMDIGLLFSEEELKGFNEQVENINSYNSINRLCFQRYLTFLGANQIYLNSKVKENRSYNFYALALRHKKLAYPTELSQVKKI